MFTIASHLFLSWARWIQSTPSHTTSLRSILILPSHLCIGFPCDLFPLSFPTKTLYTFLLSHACYMPHPSHFPWLDHPNNIWWIVQIMKPLIMQSSLASCHFLPLRYKYSPQPPVLKHPQSLNIFKTLKLRSDLLLLFLMWWVFWNLHTFWLLLKMAVHISELQNLVMYNVVLI
jgi:hypothetical protein